MKHTDHWLSIPSNQVRLPFNIVRGYNQIPVVQNESIQSKMQQILLNYGQKIRKHAGKSIINRPKLFIRDLQMNVSDIKNHVVRDKSVTALFVFIFDLKFIEKTSM